MKVISVITTINPPTQTYHTLINKGSSVIAIGDAKTRDAEWYRCPDYYSLGHQHFELDFEIARQLPTDSYSRKNIGYLIAMQKSDNNTVIFDTDDDNIPNDNWKAPEKDGMVNQIIREGWCNVYSQLTGEKVWPRGFPINLVGSFEKSEAMNGSFILDSCPIRQGVADKDPDVDAVWRMVMQKEVNFTEINNIVLGENVWCPFNSQCTWWFKEAFPLMYLPVTVPFRMTDIWRSFVAQRILWGYGYRVEFHSPAEVVQMRNAHNLMADFKDEIKGYLHNEEIAQILMSLALTGTTILERVILCYKALIREGIIDKEELYYLDLWIKDVKDACKHISGILI